MGEALHELDYNKIFGCNGAANMMPVIASNRIGTEVEGESSGIEDRKCMPRCLPMAGKDKLWRNESNIPCQKKMDFSCLLSMSLRKKYI